MVKAQNDPPLPGYPFNAHPVVGLAPIEVNSHLGLFIDRPLGMKGYTFSLTIRGQGVAKNQEQEFVCRSGDILLFPSGEIHRYGRHPEARKWYHQWVYLRPRVYRHERPNQSSIFTSMGFFHPDEAHQPHFSDLFGQIINTRQGEGRYLELLAVNLLEQLLPRRMEAISESLHPSMGNRVREACQYISDHPADSNFNIISVTQHVCLSPSCLSHPFRQQLRISVLGWRKDQRINQAKLLLSTTRTPIATVGRNVGLDDRLCLPRVSKKCTGASPSELCADCEEKVNDVTVKLSQLVTNQTINDLAEWHRVCRIPASSI